MQIILFTLAFAFNSYSSEYNPCANDMTSLCSGIKDKAAIQKCLFKNNEKLSKACNEHTIQILDLKVKNCSLDLIRLCPNNFSKKKNNLFNHIECLFKNKSKLSKKCRKELELSKIIE